MAENQSTLFRRETMERISSPDRLTSYLRVTNPGIWTVLLVVIALLAGIFAWSAVGILETTTPVAVAVESHKAEVIPTDNETLGNGMTLRVAGQEFILAGTHSDEYGRVRGYTDVSLTDGTYDGIVVVEQIHPIEFLFTSD